MNILFPKYSGASSLNKNKVWPIPGLTILMLVLIQTTAGFGMDMLQEADSLTTQTQDAQVVTSNDADYDAYIKELYGAPEKPKTAETAVAQSEENDEPKTKRRVGPAPGLLKRSILNGTHLAFNASSPYTVSSSLFSWYSYIDAGVTLKMPYEIEVENIPIYFLFEISSFSFENSYPEGGSFAGLSYILQASTIGDHAGAALGFGVWDANIGSMMEVNYRLRPTKNTFLRVGTRGVLITQSVDLDLTWWLELRLSMGLEL